MINTPQQRLQLRDGFFGNHRLETNTALFIALRFHIIFRAVVIVELGNTNGRAFRHKDIIIGNRRRAKSRCPFRAVLFNLSRHKNLFGKKHIANVCFRFVRNRVLIGREHRARLYHNFFNRVVGRRFSNTETQLTLTPEIDKAAFTTSVRRMYLGKRCFGNGSIVC